MSSAWITNAVPLTQLTIGFAGVGAAYAAVGTFSAPVEQMFIISTFNQPVQLSLDGTNDHIAVPAGSTVPVYFPVQFKTNNQVLPKTTVSVKQIVTPPTAGSLYIGAFSAVTP